MGVEGEATTQTSEQSLIEEAVGVDSKEVESDGTMTSQALAARLDFLVQSSSMPEKAMAPVQDLIEALQEDDSAQQEQAEMAAAKAKKSDEVGKLGEDEGEVPWWKKQWARYDAGFYRSQTHTLNGLTYLRQCVPYFFGALCRPGESGAHCEDR